MLVFPGRLPRSVEVLRCQHAGTEVIPPLHISAFYPPQGRYVNNKKNGEGVYAFINADVYEGEFRDDRMDGYGVYTFSHEGRYEVGAGWGVS